MIFSSFLRRDTEKKPGKLWALIDIQSGLVRASLVNITPNMPSRIVYTIEHHIAHKTDVNASYITKMMVHGVKEIALKLAHEGMQRVHSIDPAAKLEGVHYVLSSPWVISQTKSIQVEYDKSTTITRAAIQKMIDGAREEVEIQAAQFDAIAIEQKIFEVKLNGYSVSEYDGRSATKVEIACAISVCPKKTLEQIGHAVERALHTKNVHHHSALLLEYIGVRSVLHTYQDYMVIHAHSELTDVIVIKNGMCVFISSFPFGIFTVVRKAAHGLRQGFDSADSLISLFDENKLSDIERARIAPLLGEIGKGWAHDLFATLKGLEGSIAIPRKIMLSAHSHSTFFENQLQHNPFIVDFVPSVSSLQLDMIQHAVIYDPGQERSLRIGLYTIAIASL